jgi:branched-chain amino acid transport system substrate-binding protein
VGLKGNFKETSFTDLLQFYSLSKQKVALTVRLGSGERVDGTFFFADGDLVGASLAGAEGREAVRRALRLRDGLFTVEVGTLPELAARRETLRNVVMEEVIRLDEENRASPSPFPVPWASAAPKHSGAVAAGAAWFPPPDAAAPSPVTAVPPACRPPPVPAAGTPGHGIPLSAAQAYAPTSGSASGTRRDGSHAAPNGGAVPALTPPPGARRPPPTPLPAPPAKPPARRPSRWKLAAALGAVVVLASGAAAWFVFKGRDSVAQPSAPVVAAARGILPDTLVLGMVASFTGSNQERGRAMRIGWETAIAEVNAAGGVHGRKLRLVAHDDGYDPSRTREATKEVIEGEQAFAIVGNVGTATAAVAIPYCAEKNAVFFGALSGADLLRKNPPDRHVFNFRASLAAEAAAAVRYLVEVRRLQPRRLALLAQEDDFGASGKRGALKQLASYGVPEADVLKLGYQRNTADVREALARLKERAADVDAVVMVATYKPAATFVRKSKDLGLSLFYTTVSADSNGLAEELVLSGAGYTENVLLTQVVPVPTSPATALIRYRNALEKYAPAEKPGSTSLEAWIGAQIFVEALKRAGRDLDTAKLVAALESIQDWDLGVGAVITYAPDDHQGSDAVFGWLLQPDGTYRQVSLE